MADIKTTQDLVNSLKNQSYKVDPSQTKVGTRWGRKCREETWTDHPNGSAGLLERAGAFACGFGGTIVTAGMANLSSRFRKNWKTALSGRVEEKVYHVLPSQKKKPSFGHELDPASIEAFMTKPETQNSGNIYRRDGNIMFPHLAHSCFVFVPKGDYSKAYVIRADNAKTGEKLNGTDFMQVMLKFSRGYDDFLEGGGDMDKHAVVFDLRIGGEHFRLYQLKDVNDLNKKRLLFSNVFAGKRGNFSQATVADFNHINRAEPSQLLQPDNPLKGDHQTAQKPEVELEDAEDMQIREVTEEGQSDSIEEVTPFTSPKIEEPS